LASPLASMTVSMLAVPSWPTGSVRHRPIQWSTVAGASDLARRLGSVTPRLRCAGRDRSLLDNRQHHPPHDRPRQLHVGSTVVDTHADTVRTGVGAIWDTWSCIAQESTHRWSTHWEHGWLIT